MYTYSMADAAEKLNIVIEIYHIIAAEREYLEYYYSEKKYEVAT